MLFRPNGIDFRTATLRIIFNKILLIHKSYNDIKNVSFMNRMNNLLTGTLHYMAALKGSPKRLSYKAAF